jgi:hypothetical protein
MKNQAKLPQPPNSFLIKEISRRLWLAQKRQTTGSAVKLYSAINQPSTTIILSSSHHPIIYLFCANTIPSIKNNRKKRRINKKSLRLCSLAP